MQLIVCHLLVRKRPCISLDVKEDRAFRMDDKPNGKRRAARALAEKAVQSERIGDQEKAGELFAEAERIAGGGHPAG